MKNHVLIALAAIILFGVAIALVVYADPGVQREPQPSPSATPSVSPSVTPTTPTPLSSASSTTAPAVKQAEWKRTRIFKGKSTRNTLPFTITGNEVKVTAIIRGNPAWASLFGGFIEPLKNTKDFAVIGPFTKGEHRGLPVYLDKGTYYLAVVSANCKWQVAIWER